MAKVKTNFKELTSAISVPVTGPGSLVSIGEFITKRIKGFTRLGFTLADQPDNPRSNRLLPLSPGYIKFRKKYDGPQGTGFRPGRSQLTLTGQLLDAIKYRVNPGKKTVNIFVAPTRRTDGDSNVSVAKDVISNGRPFMGIDKQGIETIKIRYVKALMRKLRR